MTVSETLGALGSWSLTLTDECPDEVVRQLGFLGHIVILRGDVDVTQADPTTLLRAARYVGVLREKPTNALSLSGSGMVFWLGNENDQPMRESLLTLTSASLSACVTAALPASVHTGTINTAAGTYTGTHQWETPRKTLDTITGFFGVEYRVNGDATIDVGTQAQLYQGTPTTILSARGAGADLDVKSIGTDFQPGLSAIDYTTRVVLLGQTTNAAGSSVPFAEATADAATVPYRDMWGNTVALTRGVSDSGQTSSSVAAAAQLALNEFNRLKQVVRVTAEDYEIAGTVVVGDNAWVYDPDNGIVDTSHELDFRGEKINPAVVRISAATWPVTSDHTVAFRTQAGTIIDLTRWVAWETGTTDLTIGDLPKTLTTGSNPVQDRQQSAPDGTTPNPPTGLALTTTSYESSAGQSVATITASWTAPTLNTDGSVITDFSYYAVRYRPQFRAPQWYATSIATTSIDIPDLTVGLIYDVEVAAVDVAGHVSAFTSVASITAAPDTTAPNAPSDPVVSSYLGQLRVAWDGKDNTGAAMPADFAIVEVHVSATSGFTPVSGPGSTTLVDQLSTAGVSYATAPYGSTRYVKLVAVDNSGNRSAPSGQVSGATVQVGDGDIAALSVGKLTAGTMSADVTVSGRFATALTGARVEMNSLGFQKFDTDGITKLVSITGSEALLTGTYKTALTGRRIEILAAGSTGEIDFYAPDGTHSWVRSLTTAVGVEALQIGLPVSGKADAWNSVVVQSNEQAYIISGFVEAYIGGDGSGLKGFQVNWIPSRSATSPFPSSSTTRLFVDSTSSGFGGTDNTVRLRVFDTETDFYQNKHGFYPLVQVGDRVEITSAYTTGYSGAIKFVTTANIGGAIHLYSGGLEAVGYAETAWININASSFTVSSDEAHKKAIRHFDGDALAMLRATPVRRFDRKVKAAKKGEPTAPEPARSEIGLIAQEAPEEIRGSMSDGSLGVSLSQWMGLQHRAIQQLAERLDALEGKGEAA